MDTHLLIKDSTKPKLNTTNLDKNDHLSLNSSSAAFFLHDDEVKMISSLRSVTYTSLKDLLPPSSTTSLQQQAIASPTNNSSWHEIPIKNPLVKHAAWAYLQPMSSTPEVGEKGLFGKFKDVVMFCCCCCQCGCFGWVNDVVFRSLREVLWDRRRQEEIDEEEEDDDEDLKNRE